MEKENNSKKEDNWSDLIARANTSPDKLNEEGKRNLASEIVEKLSVEKLNKFIKEYGYEK